MQVYKVLFLSQLLFYVLGCAGVLVTLLNGHAGKIFLLPRLFLVFSVALILSWRNLITGKRIVQWEPTIRNSGVK